MMSVGQFVVFRLANSRYGIEIRSLVEVVNMVALTPVPTALGGRAPRRAAAGLINVRGVIMAVFDLRSLFELSSISPTNATRILIVKAGERSMGLIVDAVAGVVDPAMGDVNEVESDRGRVPGTSEALTHVYQVPDGLVLIIDVDRLLADVDVNVSDSV